MLEWLRVVRMTDLDAIPWLQEVGPSFESGVRRGKGLCCLYLRPSPDPRATVPFEIRPTVN